MSWCGATAESESGQFACTMVKGHAGEHSALAANGAWRWQGDARWKDSSRGEAAVAPRLVRQEAEASDGLTEGVREEWTHGPAEPTKRPVTEAARDLRRAALAYAAAVIQGERAPDSLDALERKAVAYAADVAPMAVAEILGRSTSLEARAAQFLMVATGGRFTEDAVKALCAFVRAIR